MELSVQLRKQLNTFTLNVRMNFHTDRAAILGASGSGKSMTLRMIAGIMTPDEGSIRCKDGETERTLYDSASKICLKPAQRSCGYLFQNYALFPNLTVEQNIACGIRGRRIRKRETDALLERFFLTELKDRYPSQLSGGQQQRTALARMIAPHPEILLLDEPFSALDAFQKDQVERQMEDFLRDYRGMVILVTHDRDEAFRFAKEIAVFDRGHVDAAGTREDVFSHPVTVAAARLSGCKNFSRAFLRDGSVLELPDWGIAFPLPKPPEQPFDTVGYRAHDFIPVWEEELTALSPGSQMPASYSHPAREPVLQGAGPFVSESFLPVQVRSISELQFEKQIYLDVPGEEPVTWSVQRGQWTDLARKGMPAALRLDPGKLLFLRMTPGSVGHLS